MAKKNDTPKNSASIIDEIEQQLEQALSRKKEDVEKELEERIKREKEEAQKRIQEIERELKEEKQTLADFKKLLSDFEANKSELKKQIKVHLDKAIQYQTEIESLTGQTLEELKKVSELNQKLEELQQDTGEKVASLKRELEERFGIVAEVPEGEEAEEAEIDLDKELLKLRKIKQLLETGVVPEEEAVPEEKPSEGPEAAPEAEAPEAAPEAPEAAEAPEEKEEMKKEPEAQEAAEPAEKPETEPVSPPEEAAEAPAEAPEAPAEEATFQDAFEKLEQYRKGSLNEDQGEVSYFEHDDRIVLDGEYLVSTLNNSFEEAKKLYIKLSQTESPKDQFFIKQEIIRQQESLRKIMLRSIRLCEKENCSLPEYTQEVLNLDVLKDILEKVSMQNWSNQDDFAAFDNFAKQLKDSFYTKITPPAAYLQSIMKQLNLQ